VHQPKRHIRTQPSGVTNGQIYKSAKKVIAVLGEEGQQSDLAFDAIEALPKDGGMHWHPEMRPCVAEKVLSPEYIRVVGSLLRRPWWSRIWTVQERSIPQIMTFVCGHRSIPAESLFSLSNSYFKCTMTCCFQLFQLHSGFILRELNGHTATIYMLEGYRTVVSRLNIQELISIYCARRSTDARDKVYGLLGLAAGADVDFVVPDYSATVPAVYEQTTPRLIQSTQNLSVFSLLIPQSVASPRMGVSGLPSCAPDWTSEASYQTFCDLHIRLMRLSMYSASAGRDVYVQACGAERIALRGLTCWNHRCPERCSRIR
jgi:Heterokaryon incompatibility protein (HET)